MQFPSFLLECCHDGGGEYNEGISRFSESENDLSFDKGSFDKGSTIASEMLATPERSKKKSFTLKECCNPGGETILSTMGVPSSTSSTPIRCQQDSDQTAFNVTVDVWEEYERRNSLIGASKAKETPATVKTSDSLTSPDTPSTPNGLDDSDCVPLQRQRKMLAANEKNGCSNSAEENCTFDGGESAKEEEQNKQHGTGEGGIFATTETTPQNVFQPRRLNLHRVLSFSTAFSELEQSQRSAPKAAGKIEEGQTITLGTPDQKGNSRLDIEQKIQLPIISTNDGTGEEKKNMNSSSNDTSATIQLEPREYNFNPLVPPSAVSKSRMERREEQPDTSLSEEIQEILLKELYETANKVHSVSPTPAVVAPPPPSQAAPRASELDREITIASSSVLAGGVALLVAKMNAATAAFSNPTKEDDKIVDELEEDDDEWSIDSLMNMTDDESEEEEKEEDVYYSFSDLQKDSRPTDNGLFEDTNVDDADVFSTSHENNMFHESPASLPSSSTVPIATTDTKTPRVAPTPTKLQTAPVTATPVLEPSTGAIPPLDDNEKPLDEKKCNGSDSDSSDDSSLPIIFDDEFGSLPDGEIFSEEDFGDSPYYDIYKDILAQELKDLPREAGRKKEGEAVSAVQTATTKPAASKNEKSHKNKRTMKKRTKTFSGSSLRKKISSILLQKNERYGSLKEESFEKEQQQQQQQVGRPATAPLQKEASTAPATAVPKREANRSVPIVAPVAPVTQSPLALTKSEDSFPAFNDPWATETTEVAFPVVETKPTKLSIHSTPLTHSIPTNSNPKEKPVAVDTPPIDASPPLKSVDQSASGDSWEQLLASVVDKTEGTDGPVHVGAAPFAYDPWMIQDSDTFDEAQRPQQGGMLTVTPFVSAASSNVGGLPFQFSEGAFPKVEASDDTADQDVNEPAQPIHSEDTSSMIDSSTVVLPSKMAPRRRVSGVASTKALFEASSSSKRPDLVQRSSSANSFSATRKSFGQFERPILVSPDKDFPPGLNTEAESGPSVQDLTDAFDTERSPKLVNRKVKAWEQTSEQTEPNTSRRPKVAVRVVSGGQKERNNTRSSSLTKRIPPKSSPPVPKKTTQPIEVQNKATKAINPIEAASKKEPANKKAETRRSSGSVNQMANIFDPPKVSKENVNKLAGAFDKDVKVFSKTARIPTTNAKDSVVEKPLTQRSFSSNSIPAKPSNVPTLRMASERKAPLLPTENITAEPESVKDDDDKKSLFSYWEKVAVTTKSTAMPSAEEIAVAAVECSSNNEMAVDTSFDFSDPGIASGVSTVDENAWTKASKQ